MRILFLLSLFFFLLTSCDKQRGSREENLLVEVRGNLLYRGQLEAVFPKGLSADDSLLFANEYIKNWIEEVLLYDKAKANIPGTEKIETLVEDYRKALIIHTYQEALINQRLSSQISEGELQEFYENNKNLFPVERPLIKGLFIKVPISAPQINDVRRWYKSENHEAVENLEKYSLRNAIAYDYFYDKWTELSNILGKIPLQEQVPDNYMDKNRQIELKDTAFYYFLNVTGYKRIGDEEPYDFARSTALGMLVNIKKVEFMKGIKEELYKEAVRHKRIKYNY